MPSEAPVVRVLLAHPDDEFACSMRLRELVGRGCRLECAYLTDGGYGGQDTTVREAETLRALERIGVRREQVRFLGRELGIGDGDLPSALEKAWNGLVEWCGSDRSPELIVCPAWEGGHQDHDATHLLALALARRVEASDVEQFPLYTGVGLKGPWFHVLRPLAENGPVQHYQARPGERLLAIRICGYFVSQWRTWMGLLPFFAWAMFVYGRFPRQPASWSRVHERPHAGPLLYERRGFYRYEAFRDAADRFMTVNLSC